METENNSTENNNTSNKREKIQYSDLFFGLYNSFVMSFMVLIIYMSVINLIIAHLFIIVLITGMLLTFLKKNPFYMFFVYGTLICGAFYSLPGILVIPTLGFSYGIFDYVIFGGALLEVYYLIIKTKDSTILETWGRMALASSRGQYDASLHYVLTDPAILRIQEEKALAEEAKAQQKKEKYYKKHKRTWIILISVLSVFGYYGIYFSSFAL